MNRLLITSQKGGVGKTTTAVNLAALTASPERRLLLIDADPVAGARASLEALAGEAGAVQTNVLPGLDLWSPIPSSDPRERVSDQIAALLQRDGNRERYSQVIIDSPPLKSAESRELLGQADDVLLVQRAEALSLRTMPALLEDIMLKGRQRGGFRLRGLLLTLPPNVEKAAPEVRTMTGVLGTHLLPVLVGHDDAVEEALLQGKPVVSVHPDAAVSRDYKTLAEHLGLIAAPECTLTNGEVDPPEALAALLDAVAGEPAPRPPVVPAPSESNEHLTPGSADSRVPHWALWIALSVAVGSLVGLASAFLGR